MLHHTGFVAVCGAVPVVVFAAVEVVSGEAGVPAATVGIIVSVIVGPMITAGVWIMKRTLDKTIPSLQKDFRAEQQISRDLFRAESREAREAHDKHWTAREDRHAASMVELTAAFAEQMALQRDQADRWFAAARQDDERQMAAVKDITERLLNAQLPKPEVVTK